MASAVEAVPVTEVTEPDDETGIKNLIQFLMQHVHRRDLLRDDLQEKQSNFRNLLVELERENTSLKIENTSLKAYNDQQGMLISSLEERVSKLYSQIDGVLCKLNNANDALRNTQQEVKEKDMQIKQHAAEKLKIIQKYSNKLQAEADRMARELATKLQEQRELLESRIKKKDDKLKLMKHILINNGSISDKNMPTAQSTPNVREETPEKSVSTILAKSPRIVVDSQVSSTSTTLSVDTAVKSDSGPTESTSDPVEPSRPSRRANIPVVNPRYQQSRNSNKWIDHRPSQIVPIGTIFQPQTPSKRSVTKLTDPKPFQTRSVRYCLYAQEQDTDGELETKLYKGDVLPTSGGGAQVVFNDIECLKQVSPVKQKKHGRLTNPGK